MTRINEYQSNFCFGMSDLRFGRELVNIKLAILGPTTSWFTDWETARLWTWNIPKAAPNGHWFSTAGWFPNGHGRRDISLRSPTHTHRGFPTWLGAQLHISAKSHQIGVFPLSAPAECLDTAYLMHHLATTSSFDVKSFSDSICLLVDLYFWECCNHIWNLPSSVFSFWRYWMEPHIEQLWGIFDHSWNLGPRLGKR